MGREEKNIHPMFRRTHILCFRMFPPFPLRPRYDLVQGLRPYPLVPVHGVFTSHQQGI